MADGGSSRSNSLGDGDPSVCSNRCNSASGAAAPLPPSTLAITNSIGGALARASCSAYSDWHKGQRTVSPGSAEGGTLTCLEHRGQEEMADMGPPGSRWDSASLAPRRRGCLRFG